MREYLTVPELAERWSISGQSVRRKIRRGLIAAIHTPGARSIRIPSAFVRQHEATFARTTPPPSPSHEENERHHLDGKEAGATSPRLTDGRFLATGRPTS